MSKYSVLKTTIHNPNKELLIKAVELIKQKYPSLEISNKIKDYYGKTYDVLAGVVSPQMLNQGLGVNINDNNIMEIVGDDYNMPLTIDEFKNQINMEYTSLVLEDALKTHGFITSKKEDKKSIELQAVML